MQDQSLANYGRPKIDGELKITSVERRSKTDRWVEPTWTKGGGEVVGGVEGGGESNESGVRLGW